MEDNDCVLKYIEIVPLDNFNNCSDVTDIKQEPVSVKVSTASSFFFTYFSCLCAWCVGNGIFPSGPYFIMFMLKSVSIQLAGCQKGINPSSWPPTNMSHLLTRKQSSLFSDIVVALSSENGGISIIQICLDPDLAGFTSWNSPGIRFGRKLVHSHKSQVFYNLSQINVH